MECFLEEAARGEIDDPKWDFLLLFELLVKAAVARVGPKLLNFVCDQSSCSGFQLIYFVDSLVAENLNFNGCGFFLLRRLVDRINKLGYILLDIFYGF